MLKSAEERHAAGDLEGAERICLQVLERRESDADAHFLLGRFAYEAGDADAATLHLDRAIAADSSRPSFHVVRAQALRVQGRFDEAVATFRHVVSLRPNNPEVHRELGITLKRQGRLSQAVASLEEALRLDPQDASSHLQLAATLLRQGEFRRGWEEYEWRMHEGSFEVPFTQPVWDGSPLAGRTILVLGEQGLGDQLQFVRYASLLKRQGATVLFRCDALLARLVRSCPGVDRVIEQDGGEIPDFDVYAWAGSLPRLLDTTPETIPGDVPYLFADAEQTDRWRRLLSRFSEIRIGINWEGNRFNVPGRHRAIPLSVFHPMARICGVRLFSFQKGAGTDQLSELPDDVKIINLGQFFADFWDTAAAMEMMDVVITNDTSVAHLAGAMGKPTWIVLPADACWRWLRDREDSDWYPTTRLFRQKWGEEWSDVFDRVTAAALELAAMPPARTPVANVAGS